jgi:membrane fusion protein, multidrug efflux system
MKLTSRTRSILLACGIAAAVAIWMLSGIGRDPDGPSNPSTVRDEAAGTAGNPERRIRVMVQHLSARPITREIIVSGRTEPNREVELRAETDGAVVALGAERGAKVTAGERIVELDMRDREALLAEAEATIEQMRLQYEGAQRLKGQEFVSATQIAEAKAKLVGAEAAKKRILDEIGYTTVEAPFDAVLQDRDVEVGDYVKAGDTVAHLVDTDPLVVVGEVNERDIHSIEIGGPGTAKLIDGRLVDGTIRYLAPVADNNTRTFRIELAIPNPDAALPAGMTAEVRLGAGRVTAHSLSPALLALADDGTVGVKAVDATNRVRFYPVELLGSSPDGVSVTGLPDELRVISVGQGFVTEGQIVEPVMDPATLSQSSNERAY